MKPSPKAYLLGTVLLGLAACTGDAPEQEPQVEETEVPEALEAEELTSESETEVLGTPMAERVATIGLINKRNNISRDLEMKPGDSRRIDDVIIRLSACEKTAPWEDPADIGAFVQLLVNDRPDADSEAVWSRVFSGWLFKNSPAVNVVEHPVYDVWVKDCAMSFPGEEEELSAASTSEE